MRWAPFTLAVLLASGCYASHRLQGESDGGEPSEACVEGDACDDRDPCTTGDRCRAGTCAGVALECASPPGACAEARGVCVGGECVYAPREDGAACDDGDPCTSADTCSSGACAGEALRCDAPPPPVCADEGTRRSFGAGACEAGSCVYRPADTLCPNGCTGGECCEPEPWTTGDVDPGPPSVGGPGPRAMAVDPDGGVHVVYRREVAGPGGDWQMYAHRPAGGEWTLERIGRGRGIAVMGVDPSGVVHAIHQPPGDGHRFVHAIREPASGWTSTEIDVPDGVPVHWDRVGAVQLEVDAGGAVHLVFGGTTAAPYGYRPPGGEWTFSTPFAGPDYGGPLRMGPGHDGGVHVLYSSGTREQRLVHGHRGPGAEWTLTPLGEPALEAHSYLIWTTRLLVDPAGALHLVAVLNTPAVHHARIAPDGTWTAGEVEAIGTLGAESVSAAMDARGALHLVYVPLGPEHRIGYARRAPSGEWTGETFDVRNTLFSPFWVAVAADHRGGAHVSFADYPMPLRYAHRRACD